MLCTASESETRPEFWHIQQCNLFFFSGICRHIQAYSALLRHIHAYGDIVKACSGLCSHIQHPVYSSHIHNHILALAYLEPETYLKLCETLTRDIQNPGIGHYSALFRHQNLMQRLHTLKVCHLNHIKGTVIQIEKPLINNDRLRVSKVCWKFYILTIYTFAVIYPWNLLFS